MSVIIEGRSHQVFDGPYPKWTVLGFPDGHFEVHPGILMVFPNTPLGERLKDAIFMGTAAESPSDALAEFLVVKANKDAG